MSLCLSTKTDSSLPNCIVPLYPQPSFAALPLQLASSLMPSSSIKWTSLSWSVFNLSPLNLTTWPLMVRRKVNVGSEEGESGVDIQPNVSLGSAIIEHCGHHGEGGKGGPQPLESDFKPAQRCWMLLVNQKAQETPLWCCISSADLGVYLQPLDPSYWSNPRRTIRIMFYPFYKRTTKDRLPGLGVKLQPITQTPLILHLLPKTQRFLLRSRN